VLAWINPCFHVDARIAHRLKNAQGAEGIAFAFIPGSRKLTATMTLGARVVIFIGTAPAATIRIRLWNR